ncbi:hypothetical protein BDF20DRAFT_811360, partial [Mycotypha africana]|uniref:uncharacterized protein n=1 Tax=Mycotypha africana TaxID=64632 RepID=UPI0023018F26
SVISSRLNHYIKMICADLDKFNEDKIKQSDSLLTFSNNDDIPMLDITVMRKFLFLTRNVVKRDKSTNSIDDMEKFSKVVSLMENNVTVATEMDAIDHYSKNPQENGKSALRMITTVAEALEACCVILEVLLLVDNSSDSNKKLLSKDLVTSCLHLVRNQLDFTIYPIIDLSLFADEGDDDLFTTTQAYHFVKLIQSSSQAHKRTIATFLPNIIRFFRQLYSLIQSEELGDDVLVIIAYISVAPFSHEFIDNTINSCILFDDSNDRVTTNNSSVKNDYSTFNLYEQLKYCALDILKNIFSHYPKQRKWIFEEILTSIGSLTAVIDSGKQRRYRLQDNRSIHITSALFMQLVQCCAAITDATSHRNWFKKWTIQYQKATKNQNVKQLKILDDKLTQRAANAWKSSTEAAASSASFVLEFLMSKYVSYWKGCIECFFEC